MSNSIKIAIDVMGSDKGPESIISGAALSKERNPELEYIFFGPTLSDVGCTYKVISRNAYEKIKNELRVIGSEFQPELMIRLIQKKIRILEIPVNYFEREGKSKITYNFFSSFKLAIKMIFLILKYRIKSIF